MTDKITVFKVIDNEAENNGFTYYSGIRYDEGDEDAPLVTEKTETVLQPKNALRLHQFFEGIEYPDLSFIAMGDCVTGKQFLSREEAAALEAKYGQEGAALYWLKREGYDAVICDYYDVTAAYKGIHVAWTVN